MEIKEGIIHWLKVSGYKQMLWFCFCFYFVYNTLQDLHHSLDDTKAEFNNFIVLLFIQNNS